jgi:DNA repair exonuclease SbcCD nuclease subunit
MKLVHAADVHLDSPLRGLDRYEGAPATRIRAASRRAVENLVALCLDEQVDALLLAGDLYDGDLKDYATALFLASQMSRLRAAGIPVFIVRGNHDAQSLVTRHLELPDNVVVLDAARPETRVVDRLGLAVHGQSFATKAVTSDLASGYPRAIAGAFNVGLLHTSAGGREGHETYAPCTVETLVDKGYDYWALGHVHKREVLSESPFIVFPGNLQGRHARELGPKGATLVTVEAGRVRSLEHRPLDVVRWARCTIDLTLAASAHDAVDLARAALAREVEGAEGRVLVARVVLEGRSRAHAALFAAPDRWASQIRAAAIDLGGDTAWVEKVLLRTRAPVEASELAQRDDAVGQLVRAIAALRGDPEAVAGLSRELDELVKKLPEAALHGEDALDFGSPEAMSALLDDIEQELVPSLLGVEEDDA